MKSSLQFVLKARIWKDTRGQDLVEYSLLSGFIVVAVGAISPVITTNLSTALSQVASAVSVAAAGS